MTINRTIKYINERLNYLKELVKVCSDKKNKYEIEKKELFTQIQNYKTKIDEAYDVFSPKSAKNDFIKNQISEFEERINNINDCIKKIDSEISAYDSEIKEIESIISELVNDSNSQEICYRNLSSGDEKEINCIDIKKTIHEEEENNLTGEKIKISKRDIRDIIYKCENCSAFMEMDINRSKLEIKTIIEILNKML